MCCVKLAYFFVCLTIFWHKLYTLTLSQERDWRKWDSEVNEQFIHQNPNLVCSEPRAGWTNRSRTHTTIAEPSETSDSYTAQIGAYPRPDVGRPALFDEACEEKAPVPGGRRPSDLAYSRRKLFGMFTIENDFLYC